MVKLKIFKNSYDKLDDFTNEMTQEEYELEILDEAVEKLKCELITINNFLALVIAVYNKFLVSNIGAVAVIGSITTSNSLPCDLCTVIL